LIKGSELKKDRYNRQIQKSSLKSTDCIGGYNPNIKSVSEFGRLINRSFRPPLDSRDDRNGGDTIKGMNAGNNMYASSSRSISSRKATIRREVGNSLNASNTRDTCNSKDGSKIRDYRDANNTRKASKRKVSIAIAGTSAAFEMSVTAGLQQQERQQKHGRQQQLGCCRRKGLILRMRL
jgi:hypothetical protein